MVSYRLDIRYNGILTLIQLLWKTIFLDSLK